MGPTGGRTGDDELLLGTRMERMNGSPMKRSKTVTSWILFLIRKSISIFSYKDTIYSTVFFFVVLPQKSYQKL